MAALMPDTVADTLLDQIALSTTVTACVTQPANFAGIAGATPLGSYTIVAGAGGADWTIANGDTSGRKLSLGAQSGNNGTATGAANFLAFDDGATLLFTTAASGDTINSGSPFTIAEYVVCLLYTSPSPRDRS